MPAKSAKGNKAGEREAPKALIIIAVVLIVVGLGVGGFYVANGGWRTPAQQDEYYKHNLLPILAAKHGDTEALEAENKLRKENGQAPLEMPKDKATSSGDTRQKLADFRQKLLAKMGNQSGQ